MESVTELKEKIVKEVSDIAARLQSMVLCSKSDNTASKRDTHEGSWAHEICGSPVIRGVTADGVPVVEGLSSDGIQLSHIELSPGSESVETPGTNHGAAYPNIVIVTGVNLDGNPIVGGLHVIDDPGVYVVSDSEYSTARDGYIVRGVTADNVAVIDGYQMHQSERLDEVVHHKDAEERALSAGQPKTEVQVSNYHEEGAKPVISAITGHKNVTAQPGGDAEERPRAVVIKTGRNEIISGVDSNGIPLVQGVQHGFGVSRTDYSASRGGCRDYEDDRMSPGPIQIISGVSSEGIPIVQGIQAYNISTKGSSASKIATGIDSPGPKLIESCKSPSAQPPVGATDKGPPAMHCPSNALLESYTVHGPVVGGIQVLPPSLSHPCPRNVPDADYNRKPGHSLVAGVTREGIPIIGGLSLPIKVS